MKTRLLGTARGEDFQSQIWEHDDKHVEFLADVDVDFDGMNGQAGGPAAYMIGDRGAEYLANGGMRMEGERVIGYKSWWKDIVFADSTGAHPLLLAGGIIPSMTSYKLPGKQHLPEGQLDSWSVKYIVVPGYIIGKVAGVVLGCKASATYKGVEVFGCVGDAGPRDKDGEASVSMCKALGIKTDRRGGGLDEPLVTFKFWPNVPAILDDKPMRLQRLNGTYV